MFDVIEKFTKQAMIYYTYCHHWKRNVEGNERIRFGVKPTLEKIYTKDQVLYYDVTKELAKQRL